VETVEGTSIRKDVLRTADPGPITDVAMRDLIDWYNAALPASPWPIAVAAEFVFRFLAIHPFQDGNGRIGRALFSFALLQAEDRHLNVVVPALAIDRHIEKRKEEYYLALRRCSGGRFLQDSRKYRIGYFLTFMLRIFTEALENDIDYYARRHAEFLRLAPAPNKILACFQESPEKMLGLSEVMQSVKLAKRTAIHALGALVQKGFLQKSGSGPTRKYRITF
jgi:Fic family protein